MLRKLENSQVTTYWSDIRSHLIYTLSPQLEVTDEALNNVLASILKGNSQVWVVLGEGDNADNIYAMIVTTFVFEDVTKTKNLLVYSLSGYRSVPDSLWMDALDMLKLYAKSNGCFKIIAYTQVERVLTIANDLGADTSMTLISWEV